ncbi:LPS-assembly protein [Primorskyibacter sedentarius]|uniref:LPS-assembly protein LptD n=2 Tax=Primorskyibacter sedentarius TaxID=745311 RepID=A0A4R3JDQ9_9RHOB|nr:LPS assembly protein LptD [Primorskyibacter sedentarius]TCS63867.1 LPS-assembly protein [Primorskyibacter sedentarius]
MIQRTCLPLSLRLLAALCFVLGAAQVARAQSDDAAMLVADEVLLTGDDTLVASGNVEAIFQGSRLTAARITYDRGTDTIQLDGPVRLTDPQGNLLTADSGTLETDFENGLLRGARMVLDEQLQLASVEARRVGGRYTQLSRVAVTSCQVCGANQVPLWQIRAGRVIHDEEERQLYFDDAQLRVLDFPVFYAPRLRLPDPTLKRSQGFLFPSIRSTTLLGFGIKVPYFIPIGDHQDITLTPYLSPVTRTLEARYRRAFRNGDLTVDAAVTQDTLDEGPRRGYLFAEGAFDLSGDYKLKFDIETTSDDAYLNDYDYADKDRLDSELTVTRTKADRYFEVGVTHYQSLVDDEDNSTQPTIIADAIYEQRVFPKALGGELRMGLAAHGHFRYSDDDIEGRDVSRLNADLNWRRRWTLPGGVRAGVRGQLWGDAFSVSQDSTSDRRAAQLTPAAAVELRWPLTRTAASGARDLIEPVMQLGWVGGDRLDIANDESTRVEFDEGNLLALSRFPAPDRRERGVTAVYGLRWMRENPNGWSAGLTLGRVSRADPEEGLSRSSGLGGDASDWLIAGHLATRSGLTFTARGLLDSDSRFSKAAARAGWTNSRLDLGASYVLLVTDPDEDRDDAISEWSFDGSYRINQHWTSSANWRYDLASSDFAKAGLGLDYTNECIAVGFSVSRKFPSSSNLEPSTDFGLTVELKGFSTGGSAKDYRRSCNG